MMDKTLWISVMMLTAGLALAPSAAASCYEEGPRLCWDDSLDPVLGPTFEAYDRAKDAAENSGPCPAGQVGVIVDGEPVCVAADIGGCGNDVGIAIGGETVCVPPGNVGEVVRTLLDGGCYDGGALQFCSSGLVPPR